MSFSPEWLALREPADHRSVDAGVRAEVAARFAPRETVSIIDLGCGSGSNLRGLAPHLGYEQVWTLVDWDESLLAHARETLAAWADEAQTAGEALTLLKDGRRIEARFRQADIARHLEHVLAQPHDLVTAAAFFDLVSEDWIGAFASALAARGSALYTVLTYDGRETWRPPHEADEAMLAAFHAHQRSDKGFGPAAGPSATDALLRAFLRVGWNARRGESPWRLDAADDATLMRELADGAAAAVTQTQLLPAETISSWRAARTNAEGAEIGHWDVLASPD